MKLVAAMAIAGFLRCLPRRRPIWLIADRKSFAGDNGEVLFDYIRREHPEIDARFALDAGSPDFDRLKSIGPVVKWRSPLRWALALMAQVIVSSQAEPVFVNPFGDTGLIGKWWRNRRKFVFLQHGVIQNDLSSLYGKNRRGIDRFVVTAEKERTSILTGNYGYQAEEVWLTGMPRYDKLISNTDRIILIMPSWRANLAGKTNCNGQYAICPEFVKSRFFEFYSALLNSPKLIECARRLEYRIVFVLHPNFRRAAEFFHKIPGVAVLADAILYTDWLSRGSVLVTDYSSVAFDFAYMNKPVVYCQFDREEFWSSSHVRKPGYFDYERDGFGEVTATVKATVAALIDRLENDCRVEPEYSRRSREFFAYHDRNNCRRVCERIFAMLECRS